MWDFNLHLERDRNRTLFTQIARAVVDDICRGRLRPGDRLPGTRTLAKKIGVDRVTVLAAYDELAAEGWVTTHPARGTFVSSELPDDRWDSRGPTPGLTDGLKAAAFALARRTIGDQMAATRAWGLDIPEQPPRYAPRTGRRSHSGVSTCCAGKAWPSWATASRRVIHGCDAPCRRCFVKPAP